MSKKSIHIPKVFSVGYCWTLWKLNAVFWNIIEKAYGNIWCWWGIIFVIFENIPGAKFSYFKNQIWTTNPYRLTYLLKSFWNCWILLIQIRLDELKRTLFKSLTIYQQLWLFLLPCKILCDYKSLTSSKSMPNKSNYDFKKKYPQICMGTLKPLHLDQKQLFSPYASVFEYK